MKKQQFFTEILKACNLPEIQLTAETNITQLLELGLAKHKDVVEEISTKAERQWNVEKKFSEIGDKFK